MARNILLQVLADGQLHSGQALAGVLGISRTAVWKQLAQLEELGVPVKRHRGQGYSLARPLDLLDQSQLHAALSPDVEQGLSLTIFDSLPSTNDYLSALSELKTTYEICLAERQTAGKGRRGRPWESAFARDLAISLAFQSDRGVTGLDGLSLVVGIAVVRALESMGVGGLGLKWPNDVWLSGQKLAGILIELSGELQTRCRVVIGLGLNVYMDAEEGASIDQSWTSLARAGQLPAGGRNKLAASLLEALITTLKRFEKVGFAGFRDDWERYDILKNRDVFVVGQEVSGLGVGIDESGAYGLRTPSGIVRLNAGEVSVRPAAES